MPRPSYTVPLSKASIDALRLELPFTLEGYRSSPLEQYCYSLSNVSDFIIEGQARYLHCYTIRRSIPHIRIDLLRTQSYGFGFSGIW